MSFSLTAAGTVEQARVQVTAADFHGDNPQAEAVRQLVLGQLENFATSSSHEIGVYVQASGHRDNTSVSLSLTIQTLWLPKVPE